MRQHPAIVRLRATTHLREQIAAQGRRHDWLAERVGYTKSFISKVVAGRRVVGEADARVIAALLDGDVEQLFERMESTEAAVTIAAGSGR